MQQRTIDILKRAYVRFRSARTTVAILSVLLALYFLGLVIPQKKFIPTAESYAAWRSDYPLLSSALEALRLNEIYVAPITVLLLGLFFANLLVVMGHRVPVVLKKMNVLKQEGEDRESAGTAAPADARIIVVPAGPHVLDRPIRAFLRRRFWSIVGGDGTRSFTAVKHRYSPIGFLLFHASFVLCLIGGLLVMYTRFSGTILLGEGQEFTPEMRNFRSITREPKIMRELHAFVLKLEKATPRYEQDVNSDLDVDVVLTYDGKAEKSHLRVNEPLKRGALSILAQGIGVSPLIVVRDRSGAELGGSYFILNVLNGQEDSFEFPGLPYVITARFFADFVHQGGEPASRSRNLNNPVMLLRITKRGEVVHEGLLPLKQSISFDGLQLAFPDVRYWVEFYVVREHGTYALYAGFLSGLLGLVLRLLFYQKRLWIAVQEAEGEMRVLVSGRSEYYPHSFQSELDGIANDLREALGAAAVGDGSVSSGASCHSEGA